MNRKGPWMLIKKDIKEDLRIGQMNITLSLLVGLSLSFAGLFQSTNRFTDFNPNVIDLYIPYLPVIIMIFAGVSIMQRSKRFIKLLFRYSVLE
jgi:cytochrome c biogenesis protein CcdA